MERQKRDQQGNRHSHMSRGQWKYADYHGNAQSGRMKSDGCGRLPCPMNTVKLCSNEAWAWLSG